MERWSIFVDVEGFSKLYPQDLARAFRPLRDMMEVIYLIGTRFCPNAPNRLFVHHIGDGLLIVSDYPFRTPEIPIAISVILLRKATMAGGMAKAAISQGDFGDVQSLYPEIIASKRGASNAVRLGEGLMSFFPVMGSALINAYRLSGSLSGSLLILDSDIKAGVPDGIMKTKSEPTFDVLDWVHASTPEIEEVLTATKIGLDPLSEIESKVRQYIKLNDASLPPIWKSNTLSLNHC